MKTLGFVMMGALLAGCSRGFDDVPGDLCKKQHMDGQMAVCDELYDEAPYVHLPKDESDHVYAGAVGSKFVTGGGKSYSGLDVNEEMDRHASVLYELLLDGKNVDDYRPVLKFNESHFVAPFLGLVAEGTITRSDGPDHWATEASLPVRVEFHAEPAEEPTEGTEAQSVATIANLDEAMTASDGSCMPALTSYGDESTFPTGASVELRGFRVPSMHHYGDDEFVFLWLVDGEDEGTLMAPTWYRGPIDFARDTAAPAGEYQGFGHGTPGAIPQVDLELVEGGGEPCTP